MYSPAHEYARHEAEIQSDLAHRLKNRCGHCRHCTLPSENDIYGLDLTIGWCSVIGEFVDPTVTAEQMKCEEIELW